VQLHPVSSLELVASTPTSLQGGPDEQRLQELHLGRKLDAGNLRHQVLKPAAHKAGVEPISAPHRGFHVLRHTAGSILLEENWTIAQVSAFLGHADVSITARIYVHAISMGDIEVLGAALSA
jgi:integrase